MALLQEEKDKIRIEETKFIHRELINLSDESITILCRKIKELKNQDKYKRKLEGIMPIKNNPPKKKRPRIITTSKKIIPNTIEKTWGGLQEFASQFL